VPGKVFFCPRDEVKNLSIGVPNPSNGVNNLNIGVLNPSVGVNSPDIGVPNLFDKGKKPQ